MSQNKGIPYRYDHNFNLIVDTADLFRSEGFREQLEACMKLAKDDTLAAIRLKGYQAYSKGRTLQDNPHQSNRRHEAWASGWIEAEVEYLFLLCGGKDE